MAIEDFLSTVRAALEATGVPYMLTGSLASSIHGVPRATNDVDIVITPSSSAQLLSLVSVFKRVGLYVSAEAADAALRSRTQFNVIDFSSGWKVDLIICKTRDFSTTEFARRQEIELEGSPLAIATAEDVLVSKLEWAKLGDSEQQLLDAAGIIRIQAEKLDVPYVEHWVNALNLQEQWLAARVKAKAV